MKIFGTVVALDMKATIKKKDGGTYPGARLTYRDNDGELKEECIHENGIKYNKEISSGLDQLATDALFTMTKLKEGDFWNVKNIEMGHDTTPAATKAAPSNASPSKPTPSSSGGSNWPTAEERAKTQAAIIRQSSLGHAVNLIGVQGDKKASPQDVVAFAQVFEEYVHNGELREKGSFDDLADDIPA